MAKNNILIEQARQLATLKKYCKELVPEIYSCFVLVLARKYGWNYDQIEQLCVDTIEMWNENAHRAEDMIIECFEETGIDVRRTGE